MSGCSDERDSRANLRFFSGATKSARGDAPGLGIEVTAFGPATSQTTEFMGCGESLPLSKPDGPVSCIA